MHFLSVMAWQVFGFSAKGFSRLEFSLFSVSLQFEKFEIGHTGMSFSSYKSFILMKTLIRDTQIAYSCGLYSMYLIS